MIKRILLITGLILALPLFSEPEYHIYKGEIYHSINMEMRFNRHDDNVFGLIDLSRFGRPFSFEGSFQNDTLSVQTPLEMFFVLEEDHLKAHIIGNKRTFQFNLYHKKHSLKAFSFEKEYFLDDKNRHSPSMTYIFNGISLKDSRICNVDLRIFTNPESYFTQQFVFYRDDYRKMETLYAIDSTSTSLNYSYEDRVEVLFENEKIISLRHKHISFTGGAHPNSESKHWIIDKMTGKIIKYNDLFIHDDPKLIRRLSRKSLTRRFNSKKLEDILFTVDYEVSKDVYLTGKGVVFQYDPYEIAPYVYGPIEVFVPYKKLKGIIRDH